MSKFIVFLLTFMLIGSSFATIKSAWAIDPLAVIVSVDNHYYRTGDIIQVAGYIGGTLALDEQPIVTVEIINPYDNVTLTRRAEVNWDIGSRDFGFQFTIGGPFDRVSGQYTVLATYERNNQTVTAETTFDYIVLESDSGGWLSFTAQGENGPIDIKYKLPNLVLDKVEFDNSTNTLLVVFEPGADGRQSTLNLRFPDELFPYEITNIFHELSPRPFNVTSSNDETILAVGVYAYNDEPSEVRIFGAGSGFTGVIADASNDATGQSMYDGGRTFFGQQFDWQSDAILNIVDCATVKLRKHGSPTGSAEVGFYDTSMTLLRKFGSIDVGNLTTGYKAYEFCIPSSELGHLIFADHILAIKYDDGDAINRIDARRSNVGAGPDYDGLASHHLYFDGDWHIYDGKQGQSRDLLFKLTNTLDPVITDSEINQNDSPDFSPSEILMIERAKETKEVKEILEINSEPLITIDGGDDPGVVYEVSTTQIDGEAYDESENCLYLKVKTNSSGYPESLWTGSAEFPLGDEGILYVLDLGGGCAQALINSIPDSAVMNKTLETEEAMAFLEKYPSATTWIFKDYVFEVGYRMTKSEVTGETWDRLGVPESAVILYLQLNYRLELGSIWLACHVNTGETADVYDIYLDIADNLKKDVHCWDDDTLTFQMPPPNF